MPKPKPMPTPVLKRRLPRFFISAALAALLAGSASAPPSRAAQEAAPLSLPFGRLLKCRLAFALEGARALAPLIATVDEDLWWEGRKIVAAGSEVHGTVLKPSPVLRDRLEAADAFVLVTKDGLGERPMERPIQGQVLEREDAKGLTRVVLLIHPRVNIPNEDEVIPFVLNALRESSPGANAAPARPRSERCRAR